MYKAYRQIIKMQSRYCSAFVLYLKFFRKQVGIKFTEGETEANTHTWPHPQHISALIQHVPLL